MTFHKTDNQKRELAKKDRSAAKTWKMIMRKVKFEFNLNGVAIKKISDLGNIDTVTIPETRYEDTGT